ncbi:DNA-3-methyladenine glycosylase [Homoserinimonas hongtaonis]|uniref:Putative 3-methyladenine DNA glycosylase n=1 Tax=Homoserinimonas hongtaonis TaxID=2079791 RepID=A0A2U1SXY4_9MICO|nr:DNA-3-methyladenine glycosylase [Salinibacterium hongtaonis]PWB96403.1 DNA-3-methyladenine glycosylase [Salinibacterium hongtaonis]
MFDRSLLARPALDVAPLLLGARLISRGVTVRLTEVEAYLGADDPGSHGHRGKTARNAVMFGPPGHLYCYFTYGMHTCSNIVTGAEGTSSGVLLRAGEVIDGVDIARARRHTTKDDVDLARGPARLTVALGITLGDNGHDLQSGDIRLELASSPSAYEAGPRTGVSGHGGSDFFPWRFWIPGDPTVSPYRRSTRRKA